jgi:hypothetical protein
MLGIIAFALQSNNESPDFYSHIPVIKKTRENPRQTPRFMLRSCRQSRRDMMDKVDKALRRGIYREVEKRCM